MSDLVARLRFWAIRKLAGRDSVGINLILHHDGHAVTAVPTRRLYLCGCHVG